MKVEIQIVFTEEIEIEKNWNTISSLSNIFTEETQTEQQNNYISVACDMPQIIIWKYLQKIRR